MGIQTMSTSKETYKGSFTNGSRNGFGILKRENMSYVGDWRVGSRTGQGIQVNQTKAGNVLYTGDFLNGSRQGQGELVTPDGYRYAGEFKNNLRHGFGKAEGPSGTYVGGWKFGKRHGIGFAKIGEDFMYLGEWSNGQIPKESINLLDEDREEVPYSSQRTNSLSASV